MRRSRQLNVLGETLDRLLESHGLSAAEFCSRTKQKTSTLSNIKHRKATRGLDAERIQIWAKALGLTRREADELFEAAQLAFAPQYVQDLVRRLRGSTSRRPD